MFKPVSFTSSFTSMKPILSDELNNGIILYGEPVEIMNQFLMLNFDFKVKDRASAILFRRYRSQIRIAEDYQNWASGLSFHRRYRAYPSLNDYQKTGTPFTITYMRKYCQDSNHCVVSVDTGMNGYPHCIIGEIV